MAPVGYSDANACTAFIRSCTKEKPDLFAWHTGQELKDLVDSDLVAGTDDAWWKAIAGGNGPADLQSTYGGSALPTVLAGGLLVSLPTVLLFLASQRFFTKGLTLGQF